MKGKYCIFYEERGEGRSRSGKTRAREREVDGPPRGGEGGGEKTVNKVVVEKEDQSWNVSAVCKKKRDGVGWGGEGGRGGGSPSALLHGDRLSTAEPRNPRLQSGL